MKRGIVVATLVALAGSRLIAGGTGTLSGEYVEARTAEVFTGGCIMGSEAVTMGKEAVLAWKVNSGSLDGVSLDGLSIVAAVAGDQNLGIDEMGAALPNVRSAVFVDERATPEQQTALVAMARAKGLVGNIVQVTPAPIEFVDRGTQIRVITNQVKLEVMKEITHESSCGDMQWFHPLAAVDNAEIGMAEQHAFTGSALGTKWSHPNARSAFFGRFTY